MASGLGLGLVWGRALLPVRQAQLGCSSPACAELQPARYCRQGASFARPDGQECPSPHQT